MSRRKEDIQAIDPQHYHSLKPEPIEVIDAWKLDFYLGNALSYIARADKKGSKKADLIKAANYCYRAATGRWLPKELQE